MPIMVKGVSFIVCCLKIVYIAPGNYTVYQPGKRRSKKYTNKPIKRMYFTMRTYSLEARAMCKVQ